MPKLRKFFSIVGMMGLIPGCGITDIADKTQKAVQVGNETQNKIYDKLSQTYALTEELRSLLQKTAQGIHLQILTVSLEGMFSPTNTAVLDPPSLMMPYAKTFTAEASEQELIEMSYVLLLKALKSPDDQQFSRLVALTAFEAIAGFSSAEKVSGIFHSQIEEKGRYEETAYAFGVCRYKFIKEYLFGPILEIKKPYLNKGALREAVAHFQAMKQLATAPCADLFSLSISSLGVDEKVKLSELQRLGVKARDRFTSKLDPAVLGQSEVQTLLGNFE